jgi:hypothetical protein
VLWEGLYFQNRNNLALLDRIVERVRDVAHIPVAIRHGAAVIHVKDGLTQAQADQLEAQISNTV